MTFGTLTTLDDLQGNTGTIAAFGEEALAQRVAQSLAIHNAAMQEAFADFAVVTADAQRPYGVGDDMEMQELDQMGSPDVQKTTAGGNLGLPLRFYGIAVQWNRHFIFNTQVGELLRRLDSAADADIRNLIRQIRRALLTPTNNLAYKDILDSQLTLQLRALLNADGTGIPMGPNGEAFDGTTHSHYLATATLTEDGLTAVLNTVLEHGVTGNMAIYINRAQEAAIRAMTASFNPYVDARINIPLTERTAIGSLDVNNPTDRAIGVFSGAEVSVKPWVPVNYQIVLSRGAGTTKALGIRTPDGTLAGRGGFGTLYEADGFPLRARALGREFGVGVIGRERAAVGFSAGGTYVAPVIA